MVSNITKYQFNLPKKLLLSYKKFGTFVTNREKCVKIVKSVIQWESVPLTHDIDNVFMVSVYRDIRNVVERDSIQRVVKLLTTSTCVVLLISMAMYFTYINARARNQALSVGTLSIASS